VPERRNAHPGLDLATVERLLTTTRAVRRGLDLERPVALATVRECIGLAQHAPAAENLPLARWLVVRDPGTRARLAAIYARGIPGIRARAEASADDEARRLYASAEWLAEHLARVPVLVVPCLVVRPPAAFSSITCSTLYGSILPAVWSFQLALRSRGLGSVFTTLHLSFEDDARALLGIPPEALQVALVPIAHVKNPTPRAATRPAVEDVAYLDAWGRPFEETP
jgi:nitroreductase